MKRGAAAAAAVMVVALAGGCRAPAASTVPAAANCNRAAPVSGSQTITVDGRQRTFLLELPASSGATLPVVFDFPGLGESAKEEAAYSHLAEQAAARGWIGVTPQASGAAWTLPPLPGPDDVKFFVAMLSQVESQFCADSRRVYAAGISNGAAFVGVLGCKATSSLAGIAMVEGINAYASCGSAGPLAVLGFNGTADPIVPFNGGNVFGGANQKGGGIVPPAQKVFEQWEQRNVCSGESTADVASDVHRRSGTGCRAATELYVLDGGGHTWAGAAPVADRVLGPTNEHISATAAILDFFAAG